MQTAANIANRFSLVIDDIVRKIFESIETQLDRESVFRVSNNINKVRGTCICSVDFHHANITA
jgi:hypothetical protein